MDAAVGAIVDAAKSFDAARFDDAVVVFTSDNGAPAFGKESVDHTRDGDYIARNHPFRGVKSFLWEGGTRVAAFVSSRNRVPAARRGARSAGLFHVTDRAGQESEIPNFKGSYLGRFPLVSADFWTSDHLSERSRSVDAFSGTRARGTFMLKRR
jgi:hypothetical protein